MMLILRCFCLSGHSSPLCALGTCATPVRLARAQRTQKTRRDRKNRTNFQIRKPRVFRTMRQLETKLYTQKLVPKKFYGRYVYRRANIAFRFPAPLRFCHHVCRPCLPLLSPNQHAS